MFHKRKLERPDYSQRELRVPANSMNSFLVYLPSDLPRSTTSSMVTIPRSSCETQGHFLKPRGTDISHPQQTKYRMGWKCKEKEIYYFSEGLRKTKRQLTQIKLCANTTFGSPGEGPRHRVEENLEIPSLSPVPSPCEVRSRSSGLMVPNRVVYSSLEQTFTKLPEPSRN